MDWHLVEPEFDPEISDLRDIYVLQTDVSDWQRVLDALRRHCQSNCTLTSERYMDEAVSLALVAGYVPGSAAFGQNRAAKAGAKAPSLAQVQLL